jgi:hypothetical protein
MPLPGIVPPPHLDCLVRQMVDSIRRIKYVTIIRNKSFSNLYVNPNSIFFDPIKGASYYSQAGNIEEAFWLVFIATHFGKNKKSGWNLARAIYSGLPGIGPWNWQNITSNFNNFRAWLNANSLSIKAAGKFGNHRKYQSLDAYSATGTGSAIGSYIDWVAQHNNHQNLIANAIQTVGAAPVDLFDHLYKSMDAVVSFGRTAKFDYLTMIGKLGLAPIEPGYTYMDGATGPKSGAHLLFDGSINGSSSDHTLNSNMAILSQSLNLFYCMQVLEDALCNWQKSPATYKYFGG